MDNASTVAKDDIRTAAFACEQTDRTDEALISANWKIRRTPGRSQPVGIPARLRMKNSPLPGTIRASWSPVANFRFYEIQKADPAPANPEEWDTLIPETTTRALRTFSNLAVGSLLSIRVRAVGVLGPGPWTDVLTARVN